MKKSFLFFLLVIFSFYSCKKEINELSNADGLSSTVGRSAQSISTIPTDVTSTFSDLIDFPVNIVVKENNLGKKYLTFVGIRQGSFLFSSETKDSTQVFYLSIDNNGDLQIYRPFEPGFNGIWRCVAGIGARGSIDTILTISSAPNINYIPQPGVRGENYFYTWRILKGGTVNDDTYLLKNVKYNKFLGSKINSLNTYFDLYTNTGRQEFEIRPIDDFELLDIEYINDASATITQQPDFVTEWFYSNNSSLQQSISTSFSQKASYTSSFSKTTGGSINVSVGVKVGIPFIADGKINTSVTINHSAMYGKSETKEDAQTYNFPILIAPRTSVRATATVGKYLINLKYKAKMRGINTGRIIYVNGIWEGISCTAVRVDLNEYSLNGGQLLKSATLNSIPKTQFNFKSYKN